MIPRIKEVCEILGITQLELAEKMGMHYSSFSKWSEGVPKTSAAFLDALVENHKLKQELDSIKAAIAVLREV